MVYRLHSEFVRNGRRLFQALLLLTGMALAACGGEGKDGKYGPEMLTNPATAGAAEVTADGQPVIVFEKEEHDFGKVIQGEVISYAFRLSNQGEAPLVIADVTSSCGCTVGDYPKEPLQPGEEGFIRVTFDSKGRQGHQSKVVNVVANTTPGTHSLRIMADVTLPEWQK